MKIFRCTREHRPNKWRTVDWVILDQFHIGAYSIKRDHSLDTGVSIMSHDGNRRGLVMQLRAGKTHVVGMSFWRQLT